MRRWFAIAIFAAPLASPAAAINWEGHDEWLDDAPLAEEFTDGVPPPLPKAMPSCDERARRARANTHEQVPLPGVNCRPLKKDKPVEGGG
jgi:hypothetical protein